MIACRGNLQCPFGLNLAAYFQQIRATDSDWGGDGLDQMPAAGLIAVLAGGVVVAGGVWLLGRGAVLFALTGRTGNELPGHIEQMVGTKNLNLRHKGGFLRAARR